MKWKDEERTGRRDLGHKRTGRERKSWQDGPSLGSAGAVPERRAAASSRLVWALCSLAHAEGTGPAASAASTCRQVSRRT